MNNQPSMLDLMKAIISVKSEVKEVKNDILRMDSKIDFVYRKLDAKIDSKCDELKKSLMKYTDGQTSEILSAFNSYASKIERRLEKLEVRHA